MGPEANIPNQHKHIFKHKILRDLAWAISSSVLVDGNHYIGNVECENAYKRVFDRLILLDDDPSELNAFVTNIPNKRLGFYFEALISFWITIDPNYELLASNVQVNDSTRTVGEFDFLLRNVSLDEVQHWEVACKFYMQYTLTNGFVWYGPNASDKLSSKLNKLERKQSLLSENPYGKEVLNELGIYSPKPKILVKGRLFYPMNGALNDTSLSPYHSKGIWMYMDLWHRSIEKDTHWCILDKYQWLSIISFSPKDQNIKTKEEITQEVISEYLNSNKVYMLAQLAQENGVWVEIQRLFIVGANWPFK